MELSICMEDLRVKKNKSVMGMLMSRLAGVMYLFLSICLSSVYPSVFGLSILSVHVTVMSENEEGKVIG